MLQSEQFVPLSDFEEQLFSPLVPPDDFLRQLPDVGDFERFRPILAPYYCPDEGRPAVDPVRMLRLELLSIHYRLSDRELMRQTRVNMAYRLFLKIGSATVLPHHTTMTYFRNRVGADALHDILHSVLGRARELGLVKDRLRRKDARPIIANMAIPSTILLVAPMRDQVLDAAAPFAPDVVKDEGNHADVVCAGSEDLPDTERLVRRVQHLRRVVAWADTLPGAAVFAAAAAADRDKRRAALALAHKVLADRDDPKASDKVLSVHDRDARGGKHGDFFYGYLADVTMDAESGLVTGINVLPANGNEGGAAAYLIAQEEAAQGNAVAAISLDGAGFRGPVLRELTDPDGLNLEVFTPPPERLPLTVFGPEAFTLSDDQKTLTCPAGQTTRSSERNTNDTGVKFRYAEKQCGGCALREKCLADPESKSRRVVKNDYEAEDQAAHAKAHTPPYQKVRREHPAIERKLSELVNRQALRPARYRGLSKVLRQALLSGVAVNLKRLVKLRRAVPDDVGTGAVRAEWDRTR